MGKLRLRDEQGRYWTISGNAGRWYVAREERWVQAEPPRTRSAGRKTCTNCGARLKKGLAFCTDCGQRLTT